MSARLLYYDGIDEDQLLVKCSQILRTPEQKEGIAYLLEKPLNWTYVLAVAEKNGVLPLVGKNLLQNFSSALPVRVGGLLTKNLRLHFKRNLFLTGKLLEIVRSFDAQNIPILPFKGPVLAVQVYGDLSARQFVDLDILVPPGHLERAVELLRNAGYSPTDNIDWLSKSNWPSLERKDIYFRTPDGLVNVELHWKLSGQHFDLPFEMKGLWARLERIRLADVNVRGLPFDDLLIYLCLHGSRHGWERFGWICDVHELIMSQNAVAWKPVIIKARRLGCENVLNLGLYLVHEFFGRDFPFSEFERVKNDVMFKTLARKIRSQLFSERHDVMQIRDRYAYHLMLKENPRDKWKLHAHYIHRYLRIIFKPRASDTKKFNLPQLLTPLYYVMRPLRLFYSYAFKWNKRGT